MYIPKTFFIIIINMSMNYITIDFTNLKIILITMSVRVNYLIEIPLTFSYVFFFICIYATKPVGTPTAHDT